MDVTEEIFEEAKKYLAGPYGKDEILPEYPEEFYITGLLFPKDTRLGAEDLETLDTDAGTDEDSAMADDGRHSSGLRLPNSIGLRCNLAPDVSELDIGVEFGTYVKENSGWRRKEFSKNLTIHVDKEREREILDSDELIAKISWKVDADKNNPPSYKMLSIFLSNEQDLPSDTDESGKKLEYSEFRRLRNERIIFQPVMVLTGGGRQTFLGTNISRDRSMMIDEEMSLEMLYRRRIVYAQGYNCSADWDRKNNTPNFIRTELIPQYQSKQIMFNSSDDDRLNLIDMTDIDEAKTPEKVHALLEDIPKKYAKWISKLPQQCSDISKDGDFFRVSQENQEKCGDALARISDGLGILLDPKNKDVFDAFMTANRAMLYQRVHYQFSIDKAKGKRGMPKSPDPTEKGKNFWRPFQIAFLLMNLRSMSDRSEEGLLERNTVDLLWFPTGGGKTEAYLALAAFSMVLRRLRREGDDDGSGVSVIMRYTLRLLTIQQFERAATLICALEIFRRKNPEKLGSEPFLIGLWVGWSLTPNSWMDSKNSLQKLSRHEEPDTGSPVQLVFCPWCGNNIDHRNYQVDEARTKWTIVHCTNPGCSFYSSSGGVDTTRALPVLTVDFDIYRRCPAMLIATVDKFARIPWRPESSSIFGIVNRRCQRCGFLTSSSSHEESYHRERSGRSEVHTIDRLQGPDLIIQDELHLITGPIGTMVGLYETAIDHLCTWNTSPKINPKIIVSTATVKGVESQIGRLFNRSNIQTFPPPGVNFDDTFFWWESERDGRKYVGISYSHRSMKFALGRVYASLLQRVSEIRESLSNPREAEPYWTMVGYFNSKRELGGAIRLVEDDVKSNIDKIVTLLPTHEGRSPRQIGNPVELTGRIKGQEIREIRRRLEMNSESPESIDVLLATNMISVGIDVDRLGLMVVAGQTKGASEYIQATGRIGRRENVPGIVFTLYNPYKPRDLSHYEDFTGVHLTLQKSVEPVGLTPFSDRAMERAIHAVLIGLIRLTIPNLSRNPDADSFRLGTSEITQVKNAILERFRSVQNVDENDEEFQKLRNRLNLFLDNWNLEIEDAHRLNNVVYYLDDSEFDRFGSVAKKTKVLMADFAAKESSGKGFPRPTPGSLRDVETEAKMFYEG